MSLVPSCGASVAVAAGAGGVSVVVALAVTSDMTSCVGAGGFTPNSRFIRSHTLSCVSLMGSEASPSGSVDCTSAGGVGSTVGIGIVGVGNTSVTAGVGVTSLAGALTSGTTISGDTRFVPDFFLATGSGATYGGVINGGDTVAVPVGATGGTAGGADGSGISGTGVAVSSDTGPTGNPVWGGSTG